MTSNLVIYALMLGCVAWIAWPHAASILAKLRSLIPSGEQPKPQPSADDQWTKLDRVEAWEMIYAVADDAEKPVLEKMLPRIVKGQ